MTDSGIKKVFILIILMFLSCSRESGEELFNLEQTNPINQENPDGEVLEEFTLSVTSERGGSVNTSGGTYEEGTEVTLIASSDPEYVFSIWLKPYSSP